MATLPGVCVLASALGLFVASALDCLWRQRWDYLVLCLYTVAGWDSKFELQLVSQSGNTYSCLSRSVLRHTGLLLGNQPITAVSPEPRDLPALTDVTGNRRKAPDSNGGMVVLLEVEKPSTIWKESRRQGMTVRRWKLWNRKLLVFTKGAWQRQWTHVLFVGCLTSQQHASISQGRICTDNLCAATLR